MSSIINPFKLFTFLLSLLFLNACSSEKIIIRIINGEVSAAIETDPTPASDDTADDPCVWVHPTNPSLSVIIGTDKDEESAGLRVYDLEGHQIFETEVEKANNVDLRYGMKVDGVLVDVVTTGLRNSNSLGIYKMNSKTRSLENISARKITLGLDVYGSCMYKSPSNVFYAIVNDKEGKVEQYELFEGGHGKVDAKLVRTLQLPGQLEGCVADDILGLLYIGEEDHGIWKFDADPKSSTTGVLVDTIGPNLYADVEGLTIYYSGDSTGYLIASSQGDNTYAIYKREGNNDFIGRFSIADNMSIDGSSETDGIDVCNMNLGGKFSSGIFVVQDGVNTNVNSRTKDNTNYKAVPWGDITSIFTPRLEVNNTYNIRK
tara:strand:+ start:314 stop:1435 length:1122 start_codon:yes stop_codon:yes gene_type:complete